MLLHGPIELETVCLSITSALRWEIVHTVKQTDFECALVIGQLLSPCPQLIKQCECNGPFNAGDYPMSNSTHW